MPAGVPDTGQFWQTKMANICKNLLVWFPENHINRHVSCSKNLKAQLDDWNLNPGISEPITPSF